MTQYTEIAAKGPIKILKVEAEILDTPVQYMMDCDCGVGTSAVTDFDLVSLIAEEHLLETHPMYFATAVSGDCVFCRKIQANEVERSPVNGVGHFEPLNPVTEGHRLFVPMHHTEWNSPLRLGAVYQAAVLYASSRFSSFNIISNAGAAASQTVPHIHLHVVPRSDGDGLHLPWTDQRR